MSIKAIDVIDLLPGELGACLESDEFFSDIPVVVMEEGDVEAMMKAKQAVITMKSGKRGVAVIVLQTVADDPAPNVKFGSMILKPAFQVLENVQLNNDAQGTGKSARKVARRLRDVISSCTLHGLTTDLFPDEPCIAPVNLSQQYGALLKAYQVNFLCYEADHEDINQVETPAIADAGTATPQIQITTGTEAAVIWFTTDGSFPAPTDKVPDSTAQVYSSPVDVPQTGFLVRACAYKAGLIASQVSYSFIDYSPA